ncbi:hypothetical protein PHPALM_29549 [Phytophthora palmivora]|uniref:Uncharacterized protein n=1 Tax=Phytophthora palmivora TaxID=4796 RepID=A0A2P4X7A6_9STRA|nr:hypothetical protein PHPALM_29549 [Phytophthora palmivora]
MAGPIYSLTVAGVQLGTIDDDGSTSSFVSVDVTVSNSGLRAASAELLGSVFSDGRSASDSVHLELGAVLEGSGSLTQSSHTLMIPYSGDDFHQSMREIKGLYLVVKDSLSCHLFRVAVHFHTAAEKINHPSFQTWAALPLPRCGTCELFGASVSTTEVANSTGTSSSICPEFNDVSFLNSITTRDIDPAVAVGIIQNADTRSSSAEPHSAVPGWNSTLELSIPKATPSTNASTTATTDDTLSISPRVSASAETTSDQQTSISSSILPSSVSWSGPVAMASLAGFVLLAIVVFFVRRRHWRNKKNPVRAKSASRTQKKRSNVQYSRIDEGVVNSPLSRNYDNEDDEIDELDAECGERGISADEEDVVVVSKDGNKFPRRPLRSSREDIV